MSGPASSHPAAQRYARHVNPSFVKLLGVFGYGRVFERAQGVWIWDHEGRRYLDFLAAYGCMNVGHNHPRLVGRLERFLREEALHFCHVSPSPHAAELAADLARRLAPPLEVSLFGTSGAEAVEAGVKLARAATGRHEIVHCEGAWHGLTLGTLSIIGDARKKKPFGPLLAGCHEVPFGDLGRLEARLASRKIAAFVVEPILGEGGVVLPPQGYLADAQALCRAHGTVMVLDEVQTGLGRTGTMFAYQPHGFVPDVIALAKALSGGIAPISVAVTSRELFDRAYGAMDRFDLHGSTFGGNALSAVAAIETLAILDDERLAANAEVRGNELVQKLRERLGGHPLVKDIRGRGLFAAIEIGPTDAGWMNRLAPALVEAVSEKVFGQWASLKLLEKGIVCQPASHDWSVLKLEPPLTIGAGEIDLFVDAAAEVFAEYQGIGRLLVDVTRRLEGQARRGWEF